MKWRLMLELVGPDGTVGVHEIGDHAAVAKYAPQMIGLTETLLAPQKNSYRWKDVFLPNKTLLSFQYKGNTYTDIIKTVSFSMKIGH